MTRAREVGGTDVDVIASARGRKRCVFAMNNLRVPAFLSEMTGYS